MVHLDKQVVGAVVVKQIAGDARSLRHPVHPQAAAGVVDAVAFDEHVNGGVKFDPSHFRAAELSLRPDVVYVVSRDLAERSAEAAADSGLLAVGDGVVADDVVTDSVLVPAVLEGALNGLDVAFGGIGGLVVPLVAVLTQRERQILNYVASGNTNKQIARILNISEQTIKNHVSAILRKLNANDRAHAVVLAIRHGWISLNEGQGNGV